MFAFDIAGKIDRPSLEQRFTADEVKKLYVTGGMGVGSHVFRLHGQEFSVLDDADYDSVYANDKALLEEVRSRFFASYKTTEIKEY